MTLWSIERCEHESLDSLLAAYLAEPQHHGKVPSNTTVLELLQWSHARLTERERAVIAQPRDPE
jgi:hypothetical protein